MYEVYIDKYNNLCKDVCMYIYKYMQREKERGTGQTKRYTGMHIRKQIDA